MCATCAYTTIQDAVDAAADADTIAVAAGTYTEDVEITRSLTLTGVGMGLTVLEGGSMTVTGSSDVQVSVLDLTIDGGGAYGGLRVSGVRFALTGVEMTDAGPDAGLAIDRDAIATITSCAFSDTVSTWRPGGAIAVTDATVAVADSTFARNTSSCGGAIHYQGAAELTISGSTFAENAGTAVCTWSGTLVVRDSAFLSNDDFAIAADGDTTLEGVLMASNEGGVSLGNYGRELTVRSSTFRRNEVGISYRRGWGVAVSDSTFTANGSALDVVCSDDDLCAVEIVRNQFRANHQGAVLVSGSASVDVSNNVFTGNEADDGGALRVAPESGMYYYEEYPWAVSVTNNVFCGNRASGDGGALWLGYGRRWNVANNVFAENAAGGRGGGLFHDNDSDVTRDAFVNNTLSGNSAAGAGGGAAYLDWGASWLNNAVTHTADGDGLSGDHTYGWSSFWLYDAWYANLPGDHDFTETLDATHVTADPLVTRWSADGDCSNDIFTLSAGSPAIDTGDPSIFDVDGTRSDIGACGGPDAAWICDDDDGDGYFALFDCDDADPSVNPGAAEACDGADRDCDGSLGNEDRDRDGWMDCAECQDADPSVFPGADEVCDGFDNDCDGVVDEDGAIWGTEWYADADGDGYGNAASAITACEVPSGYTTTKSDCDDNDSSAYPGATEIWYDGIDQRCNGGDDFDQDGDGDPSDAYGGTDCDDTARNVHPGAGEIWYDGADQNCDGADDYDQDGDGERSDAHGGADCDDTDPTVHPGADDEPGDGVDGDCDGEEALSDDTDLRVPDNGCKCTTSGAPPQALLFLVALVTALRGRTSQRRVSANSDPRGSRLPQS